MAGELTRNRSADAPELILEQFVDENLGNSSYLVGSRDSHQAVLIDPPREVDLHLRAAKQEGVDVTHVLETHIHNDFVSGSREVALRTGATVAASRDAKLEFDHLPLSEGDRVPLGDFCLRAVATPGHTPEHLSFLLARNDSGTPLSLFSGGALIVGGAARTDLLGPQHTPVLTQQLFETIGGKLLKLPDAVLLYPTHGAGSFCSAPPSAERVSTIGRERTTNPFALARTEDEFRIIALRGLPPYPAYFREMRAINRHGPRLLRDLPRSNAMSPSEVQSWVDGGGAVLDARPPDAFVEAHVPSAYGISVDAPLTTWAGWLIPFNAPLVLVADSAAERNEAAAQLVTIGYDDVRGYLKGGMRAWISAGLAAEKVPTVAPDELRARLGRAQPPLVLDVREDLEWDGGHIPGALHIRNGRLPWEDLPLPKDRPIVVHCAHSARSTAGISVLARKGYRNLTLLAGGFVGWRDAGFEVVRDSGSSP